MRLRSFRFVCQSKSFTKRMLFSFENSFVFFPETYLSLKLSTPKITLSNPLNSIRSQGILEREEADP
jgi:hypothetical protein